METIVAGTRIKTLRKYAKLSQKDFSEKVGVTQSTLSAYENGNALPSVDILINIANCFNVSLDWLCGISSKTFPLASVGDIGKVLFAIDDISNIRYELDVIDKMPNDIESGSTRWCVAIKFYGNDTQHSENASLCQMLSSFANYRQEFETYFIDKEFYDAHKDRLSERYMEVPLEKKVYRYMPTDERIALRNKLLIETLKEEDPHA